MEYGDSEEDGERLLNFLDDVRISSCRLIVSPADVAVSVSREIVLILVFFFAIGGDGDVYRQKRRQVRMERPGRARSSRTMKMLGWRRMSGGVSRRSPTQHPNVDGGL